MVNASNPFRPSINRGNGEGIMNVDIELNSDTVNKTHYIEQQFYLKEKQLLRLQ